MAINFPSNPADGEEYIDAGSGTEWVYNSADKSWTMTGAGSSSPFNFRGGYDFTTNNTIGAVESGDLFIHEGADGTVGSGYAGLSGQITTGTLVLWDGIEFIKLSSSVPGYPDIDDPGYQNGTLDERYLSLAADAPAQTVASTGTTTFDGIVEAGGGVKVTGGSSAGVKNGIVGSSDSKEIDIITDSELQVSFKNIDGSGLRTELYCGGPENSLPNTANLSGCFTNVDLNDNVVKGATYYGFRTRGDFSNTVDNTGEATARGSFVGYDAYVGFGDRATSLIGFKWSGVGSLHPNDANAVAYGFYSNQNVTADGYAFNFSALGSAPNFLKGDTYIGGTATRNTRELWESLLTEEEKEQLAAGTLAIPANVSTPGDGSFVRQWWYDQQSAENQALIDSGELEYPERYQAANFVDTFVLGDDTNINLLSNGRGEFSGGVKVSGGNLADIEYGLVKSQSSGSPTTSVIAGSEKILEVFGNGEVNVGSDSSTNVRVIVQGGLTGNASTSSGFKYDVVQLTDTSTNWGFHYNGSTEATANVTTVNGFACYRQGSNFGTVTNFAGFNCASNYTDVATNNVGFYSGLSTGAKDNYNFYADGTAPNYFKGNIDCDGLINGAFSLRMESDDPAAFTTTLTTDEEGNEVSNSVYNGTTEDLLSIIKDLRARVTALEAAAQSGY